jgi:hypothetical protein
MKYLRKGFGTVWIIILVSLFGCSKEHEEAIIFNDSYSKKKVIEDLSKQDIFYRIEGETIWYKVSDREKVEVVRETALKNRAATFGFYDFERKTKFINLLDEQSISYETYKNQSGEYIVWVDIGYKSDAQRIFHQITFKK